MFKNIVEYNSFGHKIYILQTTTNPNTNDLMFTKTYGNFLNCTFKYQKTLCKTQKPVQRGKSKSLRYQFSSCHSSQVHPVMCFGIGLIIILNINEELTSTALFKYTHQWGFECLHVSCWNLVNL